MKTDSPKPSRSPAGVKWTPQQRTAIDTVGTSLLVSAAAGSGKTAVLAERCAHLICDAKQPCDIDQLLVVTFTEAAAAEMRERIQRALRSRREKKDSPRLARQMALIEHAHISTLHGFCSRILRQHFHLLGLDPNFDILDGDEAILLRSETARQLFNDRYDTDSSGRFQAFIDDYGNGEDERLIGKVIHTHEMLNSLVDPAGWRDKAHSRIDEAIAKPLADSDMGREFLELVRLKLAWLFEECLRATEEVQNLGGFHSYLARLGEYFQIIQHLKLAFEENGYDALCELHGELDLEKLPSVPTDFPNKDVAKKLMDGVKDELSSKGELAKMLVFSSNELRDGLKRIRPHVETFLELVEQFGKRYAAAKDGQQVLDFSDLERFALKILRENLPGDALSPSPLARSYHNTFVHVLVDEYQDINEVQNAILKLVSRECLYESKTPIETTDVEEIEWRNGQGMLFAAASSGSRKAPASPPANLFCVGDVKQSIYRFRLAEPSLFLDRQARFKNGKSGFGQLIDLPDNFRSRAPLLDVINGIFERLMTKSAAEFDYDNSHRLRAGATFPSGNNQSFKGAPIEFHLLPANFEPTEEDAEDLEREEREAKFVAARIRQLMGMDGGKRAQIFDKSLPDRDLQYRPVRWSDIVILLRAVKYKSDHFTDMLRGAGIPVHSDNSTGYFESMEVRDMVSMCHLLDNQRQDVPMAAVLRSPLCGLADPEDSLARIRFAYADRNVPVPFHQAVVRYAKEQGDELAARLNDFLDRLSRWRTLAHQRPLAEVLWTIYQETGYLAFVSGLRDGTQRAANLLDLHERAQQFGTFRRQGLSRFMTFLESLQDESDLGQPSVASAADDAVRIMSIHRSKGLEFPVVIIPDLGKKFNLADAHGSIVADRHAYLGVDVVDDNLGIIYPSLASMLAGDRIRRRSMAEELRVLYVALTRAKEHLILVGSNKPEAIEKWKSRWTRHAGALPPDAVLGANTMLDWLGPVATAMGRGGIEIITHDDDEIAQLAKPPKESQDAQKQRERFARLEPIAKSPPNDPQSRDIIHKLTSSYPHSIFATVAAATSVTALTKHGRLAPVGYDVDPRDEKSERFEQTLDLPKFMTTDAKPAATDVGEAMHLVLQYFDFTRDDVDAQIAKMVEQKLVAPNQAAVVNRDDIAWLLKSEVGKMLRENAKTLRRELPVTFSTASSPESSNDPLDRVMVRGRLDALIPRDDGLVLIDYKTDRVSASTLKERADFYREQLAEYAKAIGAISGQPVVESYLVFLTPREIVRV